jgi:hypothetical protein
MPRVLRKLLLLSPVALLFAGVVAWRDPAHLLDSGRYEAGVAALLVAGKDVAGVADCDERLLQARYVEGLRAPPDVLVLGSSRMAQVGEKAFPGARLHNASVSGASFEDLAAIYELYRARGLLPRRLVVGLDPWLLNRNHGQDRWRSLAAPYAAFAAREGLAPVGAAAPSFASRLREALSPAYFQASLRTLRTQPLRRQPYHVTRDPEAEEESCKRADGTHVYARSYRTRSQREVDDDAASYARATPVYSLGAFGELDPDAQRKLERFVRRVQADGVMPTLVLVPYHPETYRMLMTSGRYDRVREAEAWYRKLAVETGAQLVGSFDPAALALPASQFYDGMHPRREAFPEILIPHGG